MCVKLVASEYVPLGFEIVIGNTNVEMGQIWNLWWNVRLTDDPEGWDSEIRSINEIQGRLGGLSIDQRLVRAQMAEFCRLHPLFPQSIDILCKEIGDDHFSIPSKMGCEGRGLLESLGYHEDGSLNGQRRDTLMQYVKSLKKWLRQGQARTPTEFKVFGFLGRSTLNKTAFVEKVVHAIDPDEASVAPLRTLAKEICVKVCGDFDTLDRPFNCFRCIPEEAFIPKCQCCYSMFLDACLLCIGTPCEKKSMLDEFRRFIEENILAYSVAISSWLNEAQLRYIAWPKNTRYVSEDNVLRIAEKIDSSLGERNEVKEWLTACLLKTIRENHRWHKRTELIDAFSEATRFRELRQ